jgi:hypothetical protein
MENESKTWFERFTESIEQKVIEVSEIIFLVLEKITELIK